jgi:hypothetical protein
MHKVALSGPAKMKEVMFTCYQSLLLASVETRNTLALLLQNHTLTKYSCNVQYLQVTYFSYYVVFFNQFQQRNSLTFRHQGKEIQ